MYLVNGVSNTHDDTTAAALIMPTRLQYAHVVALRYLVPMIILHGREDHKLNLDIVGTTTSLLRESLFRKYLN